MRKAALIGAVLGLSAMAYAQTPKPNVFKVYDDSTEYTSRGNVGTNEGELLNMVPGKHFGFLRIATQMKIVCQDQNTKTAEKFWVVFRKADKTGQPDITVQNGVDKGIIYQQGPFSISGTGTGAATAWVVTLNLSKPVILPDGDFFFGVRIPASPNWANDGFSCHMSGYYPTSICGEHFRQGIKPKACWGVIFQNGLPNSVGEPTGDRMFNFELDVQGATLQPFAVDPAAKCAGKKGKPDLGLAGLWPDLVDLEKYGYLANLGWRLREVNYASGLGFVFLAQKQLPLPINLPFGRWYLNPADPFFTVLGGLPVTLSTTGEGDTPILNPPTAARQMLLGTFLYAQGVAVDAKTGAFGLTNWCGMSL